MSSSRDAILSAIRQHVLHQTELPSLDHDWMQFADPVDQFATVLAAVGGQCLRVSKLSDINAKLESLPQFVSAFVRCSTVPEVDSADAEPPSCRSTASSSGIQRARYAAMCCQIIRRRSSGTNRVSK